MVDHEVVIAVTAIQTDVMTDSVAEIPTCGKGGVKVVLFRKVGIGITRGLKYLTHLEDVVPFVTKCIDYRRRIVEDKHVIPGSAVNNYSGIQIPVVVNSFNRSRLTTLRAFGHLTRISYH